MLQKVRSDLELLCKYKHFVFKHNSRSCLRVSLILKWGAAGVRLESKASM